ncbi:MAG TPA: DUF4097 family beta strand repeat-containing protein [Balneolaceae bacterium]|nr:DUF4097 family beta strand repeat-containing protein [Balneolaceae bacterium]
MKYLTLLLTLFLAFVFQPARAQQFTYDLGNSGQKAIKFSLSNSDITIEGYNGSEVVIENTAYEPPPERADGLRPLYGAGVDNTGIGLSVEEENGVLKVVQATSNDGEFIVKVPNKVRIMVEEMSWASGDISISNHNGEIEIQSKTGDIKLENITGPVIASSTSGDVDIVFSEVSSTTPSSISLVSGYIDVTMPASTKADLYLSSISGEIYTNLDIEIKGEEENMMRLAGGRNIEGTLNGGGAEISLKTISGDIYLRKSEGAAGVRTETANDEER